MAVNGGECCANWEDLDLDLNMEAEALTALVQLSIPNHPLGPVYVSV